MELPKVYKSVDWHKPKGWARCSSPISSIRKGRPTPESLTGGTTRESSSDSLGDTRARLGLSGHKVGVGVGRSWQELAGVGRSWQELAGVRKSSQMFSGVWYDMQRARRSKVT